MSQESLTNTQKKTNAPETVSELPKESNSQTAHEDQCCGGTCQISWKPVRPFAVNN